MNFETIYQDIITNVLPKVQEGLTITKDYVFEFMERYVTYLIAIDILTIVTAIVVSIVAIVLFKKSWRWTEDFDSGDREPLRAIIGVCLVFIILSSIGVLFDTVVDLIKVLTIPEVRIFEEYQNMKGKF